MWFMEEGLLGGEESGKPKRAWGRAEQECGLIHEGFCSTIELYPLKTWELAFLPHHCFKVPPGAWEERKVLVALSAEGNSSVGA